MTLNDVMAVILRYFTEFGKHAFQHNYRVYLWRNLCMSPLYFVVRARCRRKESSRSLSHLLMSFLLNKLTLLMVTAAISCCVFSERELMFMFAICRRRSVSLSVCRLSSVTFVHHCTLLRRLKFSAIFLRR